MLSKKEQIKIFVSDFDGIFTDCKLTVYSDGTTSKTMDYKDIMAVANLLKKGIIFAVISGDKSVAIDLLKEKFPVIETFQNERQKLQVLKNLLKKYNLEPENLLYMGDDINDSDCLQYAAFPVTVNNAHESIKKIPDIYITTRNGGSAAVREIVDLII